MLRLRVPVGLREPYTYSAPVAVPRTGNYQDSGTTHDNHQHSSTYVHMVLREGARDCATREAEGSNALNETLYLHILSLLLSEEVR